MRQFGLLLALVTLIGTHSQPAVRNVPDTSDAAVSAPVVALSAFTPPAPAVTLSATGLVFGKQWVGTTSPAQTVTLTNSGTAPLNITSIAILGSAGSNSSEFAQTNTCGSSVAIGANCTISVTFTPPVAQTRMAALTITDNASNSPQTVLLTGDGVEPPVMLPTSLAFGNQLVGATSAAKTVTLTNNGTATLNITSIAITGANGTDFSQTNTCGTTAAPGASCTISVTFTPTALGLRTASISIADNPSGGPQTILLTGAGAAPVTVSAASLTFADQAVGTTSASRSVTLTNVGTASLNISSVTINGANAADFSQTNTCGTAVGPGASCTISVTFTPTGVGSRAASISIAHNAMGSPQTIGLAGTGVPPPTPAITLSATGLAFGNQLVGTTSAAKTVTLTNNGTAALNITGIAITGANDTDFSLINTCGATVAPGAGCAISLTFKPTATGTRTASVSITDNASGSPQTIMLTGTGTTPAPVVTLSATSLTFGNQLVGAPSTTRTVRLANSGTAAVSIATIAITGTNSGDFAQTNDCGTNVAAGANCVISVAFTPAAGGIRTASITITDNASGSPHTVSLTGTGLMVTLSAMNLTFANQAVGTISDSQAVTLTNSSSSTLSLTRIEISGPNKADFDVPSYCGYISPGASCYVVALFSPTGLGVRTASITIYFYASGSHTISLSGTGTPPAPVLQQKPVIGAVVNAASYRLGSCVPTAPGSSECQPYWPLSYGTIVTLFGQYLAHSTQVASSVPLPATLSGASIGMPDCWFFIPPIPFCSDRASAYLLPLLYVSPTQINFVLPPSGQPSLNPQPISFPVFKDRLESADDFFSCCAFFSPGIFTVDQTGSGQGTVMIAGTASMAAPAGMLPDSRPARRGEYVSIYCTGLGPVSNPPPGGMPALASPLSRTDYTPVVTIGGVPATVTFSGLAPGFVGLYQANVQVPDGAPSGNAVPVVITMTDSKGQKYPSNEVTIGVQ